MEYSIHKKNCLPQAIGDRRRTPRYRFEMNVSLQILVPEETFTPIIYECNTHDVSRGGMRVAIEKLPNTMYKKLLSTTRFARISFNDPFNGAKIKLTYRIVWLDYRKPDPAEKFGPCYMALSLEERDNQNLSGLVEFMREIQTRLPMMLDEPAIRSGVMP